MASQYTVDDTKWPEVLAINGYAVFMGYLMMGVRGLGVLVVTWTTVILSGFFSDLRKKDFWCLAGIALIQTAGILNFLLNISDMVRSWWGLLLTTFATVQNNEFGGRRIRRRNKRKTAYILAGIQVFVLVIILFPSVALYMLGLYISAGVSLWRLVEQDFGHAGGANMKPALQVLYSLAVAQGVLYVYKSIHGLLARIQLPTFAADWPGMVDEELIAEYLEETLAGCEKHPSFATRRNLVTYSVNLMMEAKSNEGFIAGIRVLGEAIKDDWPSGRKVQAKYLLTRSDSSSHMIQRLLKVLGPGSPYSAEIRTHAARILALVARGRHIRLEEFPGVIESISSVLDPSADEQENRWRSGQTQGTTFDDQLKKDYDRFWLLDKCEQQYLLDERKGPVSPDFSITQWLVQHLRRTSKSSEVDHGSDGLLMDEALLIIHLLAVDDEENPRKMSRAVLHKFAKATNKLHTDGNHDAILEKYWVQWLVYAIKEANSRPLEKQLRIAINIKDTMKGIFNCLDCGATQKKQGIQILLHLSLDMSSFIRDSISSRRLAWILAFIFCSYNETRYWRICGFTHQNDFYNIKRLAYEKLKQISTESLGTELIGHTLGDLTGAFVDKAGDISIRTHAAIIMEGVCASYDPYANFGEEVTKIFAHVIPNVVMEILTLCAPDVEEGGGRESNERLRKPLVSMCRDVYMKRDSFELNFKEIASKICEEQGKTFEYFKSLIL